jgi:hypothetical protein
LTFQNKLKLFFKAHCPQKAVSFNGLKGQVHELSNSSCRPIDLPDAVKALGHLMPKVFCTSVLIFRKYNHTKAYKHRKLELMQVYIRHRVVKLKQIAGKQIVDKLKLIRASWRTLHRFNVFKSNIVSEFAYCRNIALTETKESSKGSLAPGEDYSPT